MISAFTGFMASVLKKYFAGRSFQTNDYLQNKKVLLLWILEK